jgi:hypothetical protein
MLSSASKPMAVRVSIVAAPMCGSRNVFFNDRYPGFSFGSPSYVSNPAAATWPLLSGCHPDKGSSTNLKCSLGIRQIISLPTRWPSDCKNYQYHIDDCGATLAPSCAVSCPYGSVVKGRN